MIRPRLSRNANGRPAFTLVELLVTVAIISILAALLLPALSRGKSSAMQTQCLSQTKQLALALQMYAQDSKDFLPWPNWGDPSPGWLYAETNGAPPPPSASAYQQGLLWPYLKVIQVYWCPVDYTNTPNFPKRAQQLSSYIMNGAIMGYHWEPTNCATHKLAAMNPAAYADWEPSDQPPYNPAQVFNDGASYPNSAEGPSQRHGSGCNVSAFDGHAQFLQFTMFTQQQYDQPGLLWCDPDTTNGDGGQGGQDCALWR